MTLCRSVKGIASLRECADMARILIGGFEEALGFALANQLRLQRHLVDFYSPHSYKPQQPSSEADIVILDLSQDAPSTQALLEDAIQSRVETGLKPLMLGVFRSYRGPRIEAEIERKGVRVVYVA